MHSKAAMSLENAGIERELEAHAVWVRALARSLVGDASLADDVAQETWLVALQSAPRHPGKMRSWLAGIARRLAARQGSRERRAQGVNEAHVAAPHGENLANLEQLEVHAILVDELRTLREPLRTTLLERYFEGLSAAEIAARSGVPAPTVRWRLQQGLDELRTRLDRRFGGDRNTWMSALAFALPVKKAATVGGLGIGGGLLMSTWMKLALGAAALVAAALIARPLLQHEVAQPAPPALSETHDAPLARPEGEQPAELVSDAPTARTELASAASGAPTSAPAGATDTLVVARFLDEQQHPIANAWLRHASTRREFVFVGDDELARSAGDGVARFAWTSDDAPGGEALLAAGADGFATQFVRCAARPGAPHDLGDLVLRAGGQFRGRVVDRERHALAHALVLAAPERGSSFARSLDVLRNQGPEVGGACLAVESSADGSFRLAGVPCGTTRIWARSGDLRWAVSAAHTLAAGACVEGLELVAGDEGPEDPALADIRGIVLDPQGHPVANPHLDARHSSGYDSTDEQLVGGVDGRFVVHPQSKGARVTLRVRDPEGRFLEARRDDLAPGLPELEIRLAAHTELLLVASDEHGPLERFQVRAGDAEFPHGRGLLADEAHAGGAARVALTAEETWFYVDAPGHAQLRLGPLDGRSPPAQLEARLRSLVCLRGRVLHDGAPLAGAKLTLCATRSSASSMSNVFRAYVVTWDAPSTSSADDGSFSIGIPASGLFSLFADAPGLARGVWGPAQLDTSSAPTEITLALDTGGVLEGRVRMPEGRSPAGVIVGINRGDGAPRTQRVGADGAFRFEHLCAGPWELLRAAEPGASVSGTISGSGDPQAAPVRLPEDFRIEVGRVTQQDLDLRSENRAELALELRVNGAPASGWSAKLRPLGNGVVIGRLPQATTDAAGRALLEASFEGACELRLEPPAESASGLHLRPELVLAHGTNRFTRELELGRIEGTLPQTEADARTEWQIAGSKERFPITLRPDEHGRFSEPFVVAGAVKLQRVVSGEHGMQIEVVRELTLAAGTTQTVDLP